MDQQHDDNKYTRGTAEFVANLGYEDIPADVVAKFEKLADASRVGELLTLR